MFSRAFVISCALFIGGCCPKIVSEHSITRTVDSVPVYVAIKIDSVPMKDSVSATISLLEIQEAIKNNASLIREQKRGGITTRIEVTREGNVVALAKVDSLLSVLDSVLLWNKKEKETIIETKIVYKCRSKIHQLAMSISIIALLIAVILLLIFAPRWFK